MDILHWAEDFVYAFNLLGLNLPTESMGMEAAAGAGTGILALLIALVGLGAASATQALSGPSGAASNTADKADRTDANKLDPKEHPPKQPKVSDAEAIRGGLTKTRTGFLAKLNALLGRANELDAQTLEELETLLVTADIGIRTTQQIMERMKGELSAEQKKDMSAIREKLQAIVRETLGEKVEPWTFSQAPLVVMVVGVNGVGKTTTIGKLAARYQRAGKKVVLAAGDTFRAAAVEQLEVWADRSGASIVKGEEGADPSSVIFSAIEKARSEKADLVLCDTAGRLQTKTNLMKELSKVHRVSGKAMEGAPHEVLMVLDATTGQNGISQVKKFKEAVKVDALALTKLDGTAKGGVVVAIAHDVGLPVRFAGVGEGAEDLRDFEPSAFVDGLFDAGPEVVDGSEVGS